MRFSVLLTIIGITAAAVLQHPLVWRKSKMMEMIERDEYATYVKYRNALRSSSLFTIGHRVLDYGDQTYLGNITIGTPEQQFLVAVDTGSDLLWVPGNDCDESCDEKHKFKSNLSSTFVKTNTQWSITYQSGNAKGFLGIDIMKFGGLNDEQLLVPNTTFGVANHIAPHFKTRRTEGILGLAFNFRSMLHVVSPLINAIIRNLLDKPLFTVWMQHLGKLEGKPAGMFTYGAIDAKNCGPLIAYEPLSYTTYYKFKMKAIGIGNYTHRNAYEAFSDTGTSFIGGPSAVTDQLAKAAGAAFNSSEELYRIKCDVTPPTLNITIGENMYPIDPVNFIFKVEGNKCFLAIQPTQFGGFGQAWILGTPFIRQFCNIFDIGQSRIGFARSH